ncbi:putative NAD(P)H-dependent D-xylose reductase xyl1 [Colletotrichum tropicale]|uniref:putative NAD(P)H-dependent D-xylose reductase xyl1 n=1 Tax=Colletotrichum aenigma TaxID=1215731 RepID=UPI0018721DB4|nr:putative NAD(P)H-dependent D-xylose reductase xyl1 [Colletotrichum aenigma]KAF4826641.1 putative NAD(P)H-dependent D-xylose reductase xyl1 [Colletotrichum tropicale]KAF5524513.1 putative NAD(P)H-dependent D-xylose reductase xyl1 [Colletotrichum aenigma]
MGKDTITLASGREMPLVGFGLWKVPRETCADTVYNAIKTGYRLFDGAYDYQNEKETGEGVRRAIADGLVKREDIFITTKLWNNYHRKEHALEMAKKQNETLGLGYIDLYLIHFPVALKYIEPSKIPYPAWWQDEAQTIVETDNVPIRETWEVLESLVDQGIAKSIGVSNFQAQSLYDVQSYARHPISALQIEHHPYLVQPDLISMAQENNIAVTAYSSFGPQSFLEISNKRAIGAKGLFEVDAVTKAAAAHNATPAQVLLRWATQRGIAVIPKSNSQNRLQQNLEVNGFDLTPAELEAISDLDLGLRFNDPGFYLPQKPLRIFA